MKKRNKTGGRVAGTPNKLTSELRERINGFLNDNWNNLQSEFEGLEPKDKLMFYERLLQYGLPKLQSTELTGNIERLSDNQLDSIINELKTTINEQAGQN